MRTIIEKVDFLLGIEAFAEIPTEQLGHIASITEEVELEPGTTLIRQDEPAESLYFIIEGKVRLTRNKQDYGELGEKDVIGTWSLFDDELPNIATAEIVEPTQLLKINREDFLEIVADYVEITEGILKSLTRRMGRLVKSLEQPGRRDSG